MEQAQWTKVGRVSTGIAAVLACIAGIAGIGNVINADDATRMLETWRTVGFFTFAGLFALLTYKPTISLVLWVIVILNKIILALMALIYGPDVTGASDALLWDAIVTGLLLIGLAATIKQRKDA